MKKCVILFFLSVNILKYQGAGKSHCLLFEVFLSEDGWVIEISQVLLSTICSSHQPYCKAYVPNTQYNTALFSSSSLCPNLGGWQTIQWICATFIPVVVFLHFDFSNHQNVSIYSMLPINVDDITIYENTPCTEMSLCKKIINRLYLFIR